MSQIYHKELFKLFASIQDEKEAQLLLKDILTPQELDSVAERWQIVKLLNKKIPQRDIASKLNISISKVTRGSRSMQYGSGGFKVFLDK